MQAQLWRARGRCRSSGCAGVGAAGMPAARGRHRLHSLPVYDRGALRIEIELSARLVLAALCTAQPSHRKCAPSSCRAWGAVFDRLVALPAGWVLRDFHSPNLIWLPEREGSPASASSTSRTRMRGLAAYDLVSLLQDARVDVPAALESELLDHYCARRHAARAGLRSRRIPLRLCRPRRAAQHQNPRVFSRASPSATASPYTCAHAAHLAVSGARSAHPDLAPLAAWYDRHFPARRVPACRSLDAHR